MVHLGCVVDDKSLIFDLNTSYVMVHPFILKHSLNAIF